MGQAFWFRPFHTGPELHTERRSDYLGGDHAAALHQARSRPVAGADARPRQSGSGAAVFSVSGAAQTRGHSETGGGGYRSHRAPAGASVSEGLSEELQHSSADLAG